MESKKTISKDLLDLLEKMSDIMAKNELTEMEVSEDDNYIRLARKKIVQNISTPPVGIVPNNASVQVTPPPATSVAHTSANPAVEYENHPGLIKSPMVGVVYTSPAPNKPPFFKEGDRVKEGDTIVIIEAMKVFTNITASKSGILKKLFVEQEEAVEFDEPIAIIE